MPSGFQEETVAKVPGRGIRKHRFAQEGFTDHHNHHLSKYETVEEVKYEILGSQNIPINLCILCFTLLWNYLLAG